MSPLPTPGGILALDLGSVVGFSYGRPEQRHAMLWHRVVRVGNEPIGATFGRLHDLIYLTLDELRPARVVSESPLRAAAMNHDRAMLQQVGLSALTVEACNRRSVPHCSFGVDDVRTDVLGRCRFPKGTAKKFAMAWAHGHGYRPANHHEADAAAVWEHLVRMMRAGAHIPETRLIEDAMLDVGLIDERLDDDDPDA